jgi:hypothetical protein
MDGHRPALCPLGINGGEFPHWSVGQICDLAVKIGAEFVELSVHRVTDAGAPAVAEEAGAGASASTSAPWSRSCPTPSRRRAPSRRP